MSEFSADPIKQSWVLDELAANLFGWPHFGTRDSDDLSWLFMHDHIALSFGELQTEDGMRTAIYQIAHRYAHSKHWKRQVFERKKPLTCFGISAEMERVRPLTYADSLRTTSSFCSNARLLKTLVLRTVLPGSLKNLKLWSPNLRMSSSPSGPRKSQSKPV